MGIAFEGLLLTILLILSLLLVGIPLIKVFKLFFPQKTDVLKEAKVRLEVAQHEKAAAILNKETEKVYSELYDDILENDSTNKERK